MKKIKGNTVLFLIALLIPLSSAAQKVSPEGISIVPVEKENKVDIYFDGKHFTSYIFPSTIEKPVLYPIKAADETIVTRGFPIEPRAGERVDHPHHVGLWFNYGDVNGLDFWNNSYAVPANEKHKYGSVVHQKVVKAAGGIKEGLLTVRCNWVDHNRNTILEEETSFVISGDKNTRRIIRITRLTARQDVKFGDNKEGMYAIRMDRAFEQPSDKPEVFTDASGIATKVPVLNNEGVNGVYRSSEGREKDAVWGTRARWVSLSAVKNQRSISVCLFDHPKNFGYPAHWHARGYGLFSVNNIGSKVYNPADAENLLLLKKGESVVFRHMFLIKSGGFIMDEEMNREWETFSKK